MNKIVLIAFAFLLLSTGCSKIEDAQVENSSSGDATVELPVAEAQQSLSTPVQHRPYDGDSAGLAEIKLIDAQDDPRGWCVDLFAHRLNAQPIGGLQGHNCFMYFDIGSPTEDQGFDVPRFEETSQLALPYFDVCMTLHDANPGSFVASDPCSDDPAQVFIMSDEGLIQPAQASELCLTLGPTSVPGGGRVRPPNSGRPPANNDAIHIIRRLSFESCSDELTDLQRWEFRYSEYIADESAEPHRFLY